MHEMSLAESIVSLVESHAEAEGFSRVKAIWLEIGELAGVEVEALTFSLDVVMRESLMEGAQVHIRRQPAQGVQDALEHSLFHGAHDACCSSGCNRDFCTLPSAVRGSDSTATYLRGSL